MADGSILRTRALWGALVLAALVAPAVLSAQRSSPRVTWGLDSLRAGFCVHFLVDPATAARTPFRSADFVPLSEAANVHPSLRQVAMHDPQYAGWTPSAICTYQFASTRRGNRVQRDAGRSQVIGVWRLASRTVESPVPAEVMASSFDLGKQLSRPGLRVGLVRSSMGKVPESDQQALTVEIDRKTFITWNGDWSPDSTQSVGGANETWRLRGTEESVWMAQRAFQPAEALLMVGSVRVEGKTELARLLHASPIRWVGPLYRGGSGEIAFFR